MNMYTHTLVATLGGQPQIVTFTLDLLLERGIPIREVVVIHPAASPHLQQSLARLQAEFVGDHYTFAGVRTSIRLRQQVLRYYDKVIDDIIDERTANGTLDTIGELIRDLKQNQRIIHFSISGGRRLMTFLSFSAALLYFDSADQLLHLYTPTSIQERANRGTMMHAPPEAGIRLIEVPFARQAQPILARILNSEQPDTRSIIDTQTTRDTTEQRQRCRSISERITPAQLKVLRAIASGQHPQEVAASQKRSIATIGSHINVLLRECRNTWQIPEQTRLDYRFLQMTFADYFTHEQTLPLNRQE